MRQALLLVFMALFLAVTTPVMAQEQQQIDYKQWDQQASAAEKELSQGIPPLSELNKLRSEMIDWRDEFLSGQNVNSSRIGTIKDQISALGPAPAEGESEAEDIAARRKTLNDQLSKLQAPQLAAVEAYSRADAIIKNIDDYMAEREAARLTQISPSPLAPSSWAELTSDSHKLASGIAEETSALSSQLGGWQEFRDKLPTALGYLALALILLTYGRVWIESLPSKLSARVLDHSRAVVAFFVSLGQIAIPMLGIFLFIRGLDATELFGNWTRPFLLALPAAGVILFGGRWLARQLFPMRPVAYNSLDIPDAKRGAAANSSKLLAVLFALQHVLSSALLSDASSYRGETTGMPRVPIKIGEGTTSLLSFALIVLAAILLFRLGNVLRKTRKWAPEDDKRLRIRVVSVAGSVSRILAVLTVLLAAAGLVTLANALIWPWVLTLALCGFLILAQDLITDLFDMFRRGGEGAREGLAPLMIGLVLILLSIPLFLLIWGSSVADLGEMWARIRQGVSLGGVSISPGGVLTFIVVFAIGYSVTRGAQSALRNTVLPKTKIDPGGQNAIVAGLGYVGIFLAAVLAITSAGIDLSSIAIVAGALSVGIGFGLQNIVSNFVAGIILLIERPISVGDWVDAGGQQGIVKRISVRSTQVETFDRTEVIVPNSDLVSQPVTNWTRSSRNGRIIIPVGVAYGTDTRKVEKILTEIIEDQPTVMIDPPPAVLFRGLGADSLDFEIRAILSDVSGGLGVTSDVLHEIVRRFTEEGIEIPFAQRDIWLRNPEALPNGSNAAEVKEAEPRVDKTAKIEAPEANRTHDPRLTFDGEPDAGDGDD